MKSRSFLALLLLLLCGCGGTTPPFNSSATPVWSPTGTGVTGGPGGSGGGTAVSLADRNSTIHATEAKWEDLVNNKALTRTQRGVAIRDFLLTKAPIKSAIIGPLGDITARFKDNSVYLVLNGDVPSLATTPKVPNPLPLATEVTAQLEPRGIISKIGDLPDNRHALVLEGMGSRFPNTDVQVNKELTEGGYLVLRDRATIENLRSKVVNNSVFFIYTHGGQGAYQDGTTWWSLWTDNAVDDAARLTYKPDIDDGSLFEATAVADVDARGRWLVGSHFMIDANFVTKYGWSFPEKSFIFLNSCFSSSSGCVKYLMDLPHGAKQGIGWSNPMRTDLGENSAAFVFDRALGLNEFMPYDIHERPFNVRDCVQAAFNASYDDGRSLGDATCDPASPAQLVEWHKDTDMCLVPSIERMEVKERIAEGPVRGKSKLTLFGLFPPDQDKVTIDGTEVPINSWARDKIEVEPADLPGPGFSGNVQVNFKGLQSNQIPLTEWHGQTEYVIDLLPPVVSSAVSHIKGNFTLRGDLHPYTDHCGYLPLDPMPMKFRASQGSTAKWTVTGDPVPSSDWVKPLTADLPFGLNGTANPPYGTGYIFSGIIDFKPRKASLSFNFLNCVTAYQLRGTPNGVDLATIHDPTLTATASGIDTTDGYTIFSNNLAATIGDDYVIQAKTFLGSTPILEPKFILQAFTPTHAPVPAKGESYGN